MTRGTCAYPPEPPAHGNLEGNVGKMAAVLLIATRGSSRRPPWRSDLGGHLCWTEMTLPVVLSTTILPWGGASMWTVKLSEQS